MQRESNGQHYNKPIERGGDDGRCWTLNGRRWTIYRIKPNGNRYPKRFIQDLSSVAFLLFTKGFLSVVRQNKMLKLF